MIRVRTFDQVQDACSGSGIMIRIGMHDQSGPSTCCGVTSLLWNSRQLSWLLFYDIFWSFGSVWGDAKKSAWRHIPPISIKTVVQIPWHSHCCKMSIIGLWFLLCF